MPTTLAARRSFRPIVGLGYLGGLFAYGVGLSALYATTGRGLPCPFRSVTGWQCPLCGGTRLGSALLHGDLLAAFSFNPLVFVGLGVVTVLGLLWTVEVLGGPAVRLPLAWRVWLRRVHPTQWLIVGLGIATAYAVLRNLL